MPFLCADTVNTSAHVREDFNIQLVCQSVSPFCHTIKIGSRTWQPPPPEN